MQAQAPAPRRPRGAGFLSCGSLLLALAGCSSLGIKPAEDRYVDAQGQHFRLQSIPKQGEAVSRIAPDWVIHPRLGMLHLHAETDRAWIVRIAETGVEPARTSAAKSESLPGLQTPLQAKGRWTELAVSLPGRGQWRDHLDLRADGGHWWMISTPPRKTLSMPQLWRRDAQGWQRQSAQWPATAFDYGGAVFGDFNADGRQDIALGMHLLGFTALLQTQDSGWSLAQPGLPTHVDSDAGQASGVALAVRPAADGDRLLLLRESSSRPMTDPAPGLAEYRWDGHRWQRETLADRQSGHDLALAELPGCVPALAVTPGRNNSLPLYQREAEGWRALPSPLPLAGFWFVTALDLGDFDGAGCADLVVARRLRHGQVWQDRIDLFSRDGGDWTARELLVKEDSVRISAIQAQREEDGSLTVVVGDDSGQLDRIELRDDEPAWVGSLKAPAARAGCTVRDLRRFEVAGEPRWLAAFAGEDSLYDTSRCRSGGALAELQWLRQP